MPKELDSKMTAKLLPATKQVAEPITLSLRNSDVAARSCRHTRCKGVTKGANDSCAQVRQNGLSAECVKPLITAPSLSSPPHATSIPSSSGSAVWLLPSHTLEGGKYAPLLPRELYHSPDTRTSETTPHDAGMPHRTVGVCIQPSDSASVIAAAEADDRQKQEPQRVAPALQKLRRCSAGAVSSTTHAEYAVCGVHALRQRTTGLMVRHMDQLMRVGEAAPNFSAAQCSKTIRHATEENTLLARPHDYDGVDRRGDTTATTPRAPYTCAAGKDKPKSALGGMSSAADDRITSHTLQLLLKRRSVVAAALTVSRPVLSAKRYYTFATRSHARKAKFPLTPCALAISPSAGCGNTRVQPKQTARTTKAATQRTCSKLRDTERAGVTATPLRRAQCKRVHEVKPTDSDNEVDCVVDDTAYYNTGEDCCLNFIHDNQVWMDSSSAEKSNHANELLKRTIGYLESPALSLAYEAQHHPAQASGNALPCTTHAPGPCSDCNKKDAFSADANRKHDEGTAGQHIRGATSSVSPRGDRVLPSLSPSATAGRAGYADTSESALTLLLPASVALHEDTRGGDAVLVEQLVAAYARRRALTQARCTKMWRHRRRQKQQQKIRVREPTAPQDDTARCCEHRTSSVAPNSVSHAAQKNSATGEVHAPTTVEESAIINSNMDTNHEPSPSAAHRESSPIFSVMDAVLSVSREYHRMRSVRDEASATNSAKSRLSTSSSSVMARARAARICTLIGLDSTRIPGQFWVTRSATHKRSAIPRRRTSKVSSAQTRLPVSVSAALQRAPCDTSGQNDSNKKNTITGTDADTSSCSSRSSGTVSSASVSHRATQKQSSFLTCDNDEDDSSYDDTVCHVNAHGCLSFANGRANQSVRRRRGGGTMLYPARYPVARSQVYFLADTIDAMLQANPTWLPTLANAALAQQVATPEESLSCASDVDGASSASSPTSCSSSSSPDSLTCTGAALETRRPGVHIPARTRVPVHDSNVHLSTSTRRSVQGNSAGRSFISRDSRRGSRGSAADEHIMLCPPEALDRGHCAYTTAATEVIRVVDVGLGELVRQVGAHCIERGALLDALRQLLVDVAQSHVRVVSRVKQQARRAVAHARHLRNSVRRWRVRVRSAVAAASASTQRYNELREQSSSMMQKSARLDELMARVKLLCGDEASSSSFAALPTSTAASTTNTAAAAEAVPAKATWIDASPSMSTENATQNLTAVGTNQARALMLAVQQEMQSAACDACVAMYDVQFDNAEAAEAAMSSRDFAHAATTTSVRTSKEGGSGNHLAGETSHAEDLSTLCDRMGETSAAPSVAGERRQVVTEQHTSATLYDQSVALLRTMNAMVTATNTVCAPLYDSVVLREVSPACRFAAVRWARQARAIGAQERLSTHRRRVVSVYSDLCARRCTMSRPKSKENNTVDEEDAHTIAVTVKGGKAESNSSCDAHEGTHAAYASKVCDARSCRANELDSTAQQQQQQRREGHDSSSSTLLVDSNSSAASAYSPITDAELLAMGITDCTAREVNALARPDFDLDAYLNPSTPSPSQPSATLYSAPVYNASNTTNGSTNSSENMSSNNCSTPVLTMGEVSNMLGDVEFTMREVALRLSALGESAMMQRAAAPPLQPPMHPYEPCVLCGRRDRAAQAKLHRQGAIQLMMKEVQEYTQMMTARCEQAERERDEARVELTWQRDRNRSDVSTDEALTPRTQSFKTMLPTQTASPSPVSARDRRRSWKKSPAVPAQRSVLDMVTNRR